MNRKRLARLAREDLPFRRTETFDMNNWKCGTAACAFGGVCESEQGQADGLRLVPALWAWATSVEPAFGRARRFGAAAKYFEITLREAVWLFDPGHYEYEERDRRYRIPAAAVAARVESLLACGE